MKGLSRTLAAASIALLVGACGPEEDPVLREKPVRPTETSVSADMMSEVYHGGYAWQAGDMTGDGNFDCMYRATNSRTIAMVYRGLGQIAKSLCPGYEKDQSFEFDEEFQDRLATVAYNTEVMFFLQDSVRWQGDSIRIATWFKDRGRSEEELVMEQSEDDQAVYTNRESLPGLAQPEDSTQSTESTPDLLPGVLRPRFERDLDTTTITIDTIGR